MEIKFKNNKIRIEKKKIKDGRYGTVNTFKVTLLWKLTCFEIKSTLLASLRVLSPFFRKGRK